MLSKITFEKTPNQPQPRKYTAADCSQPGVYRNVHGDILVFMDGEGRGWYLTNGGVSEPLVHYTSPCPAVIASNVNAGRLVPVDIKISHTDKEPPQ